MAARRYEAPGIRRKVRSSFCRERWNAETARRILQDVDLKKTQAGCCAVIPWWLGNRVGQTKPPRIRSPVQQRLWSASQTKWIVRWIVLWR